MQTSHITPQQAGGVISAIKPRLAAVHHLTVNDASRVAIVSDIRVGYPEGVQPGKKYYPTTLLAGLRILLLGAHAAHCSTSSHCVPLLV